MLLRRRPDACGVGKLTLTERVLSRSELRKLDQKELLVETVIKVQSLDKDLKEMKMESKRYQENWRRDLKWMATTAVALMVAIAQLLNVGGAG